MNYRFRELRRDLDKLTEVLLKSVFEFGHDDGELYHYTRPNNAASIVESQIFRASFIRSTSDPLEFSSSLIQCRNWICADTKSIHYTEFPLQLFQSFNREAISPSIRPYFCSFSKNPKSEFLRKMYGDTVIHMRAGALPLGPDHSPFLVQCKYLANPKEFIYDLLNRWVSEVLLPSLKKHNLDIGEAVNGWLANFMHVSFVISLGIKDHFFEEEEEWRFIAAPVNPDIESVWHLPRCQEYRKDPSFEAMHEYLPLKINELGYFPQLSLR